MDDYISREAAKQILSRMLTGNAAECACNLIDCVLPADVEPVRRWIPCSERMPNPGERVLATDGGFVGEMYIGKRGEWRRYNVTYIEDLMALDILWWMPLPEPPEEGEVT